MKRQPFITTRIMRYLWWSWRYELTLGGKYLVGGLLLAGLGTVSVRIPIYQIFCGVLILLFVAGFVGSLVRPNVKVSGEFPLKAGVDHPVTAQITVTNVGLLPAYDLTLGFFDLPDALRVPNGEMTIPMLRRGESVTVPITLEPLRRGLHVLPDLRAYSTFPFNIGRFGKSREFMGALLVMPKFHPIIEIDVPIGNRYQPGGIALTSNIGESPEYIGNREYVPGEPAKRLDFRAWARLGKPVVREYQEEYYCRVALVLDTYVPPKKLWGLLERDANGLLRLRKRRPNWSIDMEAGVSLAASVADSLSRGEYLIDLFAAGPELYIFRAGRHTAHLESLLEILACVEASQTNSFDKVTPALVDELTNISTVICVFLDWDDSRRELARSALEAGCDLKVMIVRDEETTLPYEADEFDDVTQYSTEQVLDGHLEVL